MDKILTRIIGIAFAVISVVLAIIGIKIFDGNYDIAVEGAVGLAGFLTVSVCGTIRLFAILKKRVLDKKG